MRLSNRIYDDKHNANISHYDNNQVGQRRKSQQDRIAQGIETGQLTGGETARLENRQQNISREAGAMRQSNGGRLTWDEKTTVNRRQNRDSRKSIPRSTTVSILGDSRDA
jgi:hypothetical protein